MAVQVLVKLDADLNPLRQQVIQILSGTPPRLAHRLPREGAPETEVQDRLDAAEDRLAAAEQRADTGPDTRDLDEQITQVRRAKESAVNAHDYEQAAALRNQEEELLAAKAARQEQWIAGHPSRPDLAERCRQLTDEIERLHALLRQHGIDPHDKPA